MINFKPCYARLEREGYVDMNTFQRGYVLALLTGGLVSGCATIGDVAAPALDPMLESAAVQQYSEMTKNAAPKTDPEYVRVKGIADRIIAAVASYETEVSEQDREFSFQSARDFPWEVNLLQDDQKNAFAMPGGKIAVFTGILPVAQDDDGLAAIMGHEVAHALLRHGRQRVLQNVSTSGGVTVAGALFGLSPEVIKYAGMGANVGLLLPWSRGHESEADRLGLALATIAGYEPGASVGVWERMQAGSEGAPPEFLSTHPSHATRIANLTRLAPEYRERYAKYILK